MNKTISLRILNKNKMMKALRCIFFAVLFIFCNCVFSQSYFPTKATVPNVSRHRALLLLQDAVKKCENNFYFSNQWQMGSWDEGGKLIFIATPKITETNLVLELKTTSPNVMKSFQGNRKYIIDYIKFEIPPLRYSKKKGSEMGFEGIAPKKWEKLWVLGASFEDAKQLIDALAILKNTNQADEDQKEMESFKPIVEKYKLLETKPALNEEARKYLVQAQNAAEEKRYADGIDLLEKALAIDPTFPKAHFNRAILWELAGIYGAAILEMKKYLMLVPNADDARASQDKIYEWEGKLVK